MTTALPPVKELERAFYNRDPAYDGIFYVGVRTTGIFCRPVCPARPPLRKNIDFYLTPRDAIVAGLRPCKRCRPLNQNAWPAWATELMTDLERDPMQRIREADLRRRGVDPATVRRHFLRTCGMTFQALARSRRLAASYAVIREGRSVNVAQAASGYESSSGFREAFVQLIGITPGDGPKANRVVLAWQPTPLGPMIAGANDDGVCLLEFADRRMIEAQFETVRRRFGPALMGTNAHLKLLARELSAYFEGTLQAFTVPLVFPGTDFQRRVWEELLKVPYGETRSYRDLAQATGDANAVRAVGRANGMNRISILIPCHRIVNANGELGGYGGGLRRKQFLLDLERRTMTKQQSPNRVRHFARTS